MLGVTFKENCPDIRNSKVVDVVRELQSSGADVDIYDPWADAAELKHEYGLRPIRTLASRRYDVAVVAVAHNEFKEMGAAGVRKLCKKSHVLYDIKQVFPAAQVDGRLLKILVTGAAGFIGSHVSHLLLGKGHDVVGLDNMNEYYDVTLETGAPHAAREASVVPVRENRSCRQCRDGGVVQSRGSSSASYTWPRRPACATPWKLRTPTCRATLPER